MISATYDLFRPKAFFNQMSLNVFGAVFDPLSSEAFSGCFIYNKCSKNFVDILTAKGDT